MRKKAEGGSLSTALRSADFGSAVLGCFLAPLLKRLPTWLIQKSAGFAPVYSRKGRIMRVQIPPSALKKSRVKSGESRAGIADLM